MNKLKFASDKPTTDDQLGVHENMADLLVEIVESESDNPLVVGLFGGWGTGKSSIVDMVQKILKNKEDIVGVYVDAWAYESAKERFGAGLLKRVVREIFHCENKKTKYLKKIDNRSEEVRTQLNLGKETVFQLFLIIVGFALVTFFAAYSVSNTDVLMVQALWIVIEITVVNGLFRFLLPNILISYEKKDIDVSYNQVEHFQILFKDIFAESPRNNVVIIVDNLDRVAPADALEMIRVLKTFVSSELMEEIGDTKISFIIPCDKNELACHIQKKMGVEDGHEFLQKFFNISLFIPKLVPQNIARFTKTVIGEANEESVLGLTSDQIDTVVFIISRAASRSPRQVKILINSFLSFYRGHELVADDGTEISVIEAAIYVCLRYLTKGDVESWDYQKFLTSFGEPEWVNEPSKNFIRSMNNYIPSFSSINWDLMQRMQISKDEKEIPHLIELFNGIVDRQFEETDNKASNYKFQELCEKLFRKAVDFGINEKVRILQWVLWKLESGSIEVEDIPVLVKQGIFSKSSDAELLGSGLAKFLGIQEDQRAISELILIFSNKYKWNEYPTKERMMSFLEEIAESIIAKDFFGRDNLRMQIDDFFVENINEFPELFPFILSHGKLIWGRSIGYALASNINLDQNDFHDENTKNKLIEFIGDINHMVTLGFLKGWTTNIPSDLHDYSVAHNWMYFSSQLLKKISEDEDINWMNELELIPRLTTYSSHIASLSQQYINNGNYTEGLYGGFCLYYLWVLSDRMSAGFVGPDFENTWNPITNNLENLSEGALDILNDFFGRHWEDGICAKFDYRAIVRLSQKVNSDFFGWLHENKPNVFNIIMKDITLGNYWSVVACKWLDLSDESDLIDVIAGVLNDNFIRNASGQQYVEIFSCIEKTGWDTSVIKSAISKYARELITSFDWDEGPEIFDELIEKLIAMEQIIVLDDEIYLKTEQNLVFAGSVIRELLEQKSIEWLKKHKK